MTAALRTYDTEAFRRQYVSGEVEHCPEFRLDCCPMCSCRKSGDPAEVNSVDECCDTSSCPCHLETFTGAVPFTVQADAEGYARLCASRDFDFYEVIEDHDAGGFYVVRDDGVVLPGRFECVFEVDPPVDERED